MSGTSNPSPQEKKFKEFPTRFRWSSQKAQTAQLKRCEAEVVRNLETHQQENILEIASVYCFRKGETRRPNMGDHYEVVEIHQLILYRPKLLCRNQAQVSKQPLWLQRTAGNIGRPGLEQFEVTQDGGTKPTKLYMAVSGG